MSRTNSNARAETAPLLPEHGDRDDVSVDGQEEYPAWQFWRRWTSSSSPSHFGRGKANSNVNRWILYTLLLIVGFVIGNLVSRIHWPKGDDKDGHGRDKGPRVPPIYELPLPNGQPRNPSYLSKGQFGAVASDEITCSQLGVSILRDHNGTAVDSAITTALCVGLLNGMSSGIGGGGFMVVRLPSDSPLPGLKEKEAGIWAIDFREESPEKSEKDMFGSDKAGRDAAQVGGLSIGIPGELRGLEAAHKLYGKLPWKDLVMPVAELAKGWRCSREVAKRLRIFGQFMLDSPTWSKVYAPHGYLAVEGDLINRASYGKTLELIAKHGADEFYEGKTASKMVDHIKSQNGVLTLEDFKQYRAIQHPAIHSTYRGKTLYSTSAPSSGLVAMSILNILEGYDISAHGCMDDPLNNHRLIEAMKFGFGARSEITDPRFVNATIHQRFEEIYSKDWAKGIRKRIDDNTTHDIGYYGLKHDTPIDHGTTHLSVVDQWGGAVSMTSTVNLIWGSRVMDPETGVIFNDELDDFAVPGAPDAFGLLPSPWNYPAPRKRPLSSTAATIVENADGSLYASLGGSGGSRIFGAVAQTLINLIDCGMDIEKAIDKPRLHNQLLPNFTTIEVGPEGEDMKLRRGLEKRGHIIKPFDINVSAADVQGIVVVNGTIYASSDSRKNGVADAY